MTKYSDVDGKEILKRWPERSKSLWQTPFGRHWIQARPKRGSATCPCIRSVGSSALKTVPDGLWLLPGDGFVDAMVVEVCTSVQNLADKRSRYAPQLHSLVVDLPKRWLQESYATSQGVKRCDSFVVGPSQEDVSRELPIRHLRVLLFLDDSNYKKVRSAVTPSAHEFFARHSSLKSYSSPKMQAFLRRMGDNQHWYTDS